jgi:hypothetical protein
MWTLFEPIHSVSYYTDQSRATMTATGLRGFWRGYFASRAAPLGIVEPAVVTALMFSFAPRMVERAIPEVWSHTTPQEALRARSEGAAEALRDLLPEDSMPTLQAVLSPLEHVVDSLDCAGRGLAAANQALPRPDDAHQRLWHFCTVLREHRGDGHVATLVHHDLDGCEALAWRCGLDLDRDLLQPARGWNDEEWAAAVGRLVHRGWLSPDGRATAEGAAIHEAVERYTDQAASRPWRSLGTEPTKRMHDGLAVLSRALKSLIPERNTMGLPRRRASRS